MRCGAELLRLDLSALGFRAARKQGTTSVTATFTRRTSGVSAPADEETSDIPPELQCPLSLELMIDPVGNAAGLIYERRLRIGWPAAIIRIR